MQASVERRVQALSKAFFSPSWRTTTTAGQGLFTDKVDEALSCRTGPTTR
jgi:hypothetical protein